MTIEIQKPELEALILERMQGGAFQSIEDVLLHALGSDRSTPEHRSGQANKPDAATGADLVAAMQDSPYRETDLEPARESMSVRDVSF